MSVPRSHGNLIWKGRRCHIDRCASTRISREREKLRRPSNVVVETSVAARVHGQFLRGANRDAIDRRVKLNITRCADAVAAEHRCRTENHSVVVRLDAGGRHGWRYQRSGCIENCAATQVCRVGHEASKRHHASDQSIEYLVAKTIDRQRPRCDGCIRIHRAQESNRRRIGVYKNCIIPKPHGIVINLPCACLNRRVAAGIEFDGCSERIKRSNQSHWNREAQNSARRQGRCAGSRNTRKRCYRQDGPQPRAIRRNRCDRDIVAVRVRKSADASTPSEIRYIIRRACGRQRYSVGGIHEQPGTNDRTSDDLSDVSCGRPQSYNTGTGPDGLGNIQRAT